MLDLALASHWSVGVLEYWSGGFRSITSKLGNFSNPMICFEPAEMLFNGVNFLHGLTPFPMLGAIGR